MVKTISTRIWVGGAGLLALGLIWAYCAFGGVVASADNPQNVGTGIFYRLVVRRLPFQGETYEATLRFKGSKHMASNVFRWDSAKISRIEIEWNGTHEFTIRFDETPVRCKFTPWQSTEWRYGAVR